MTYVIADACIDVKDRSCVDVCPVDCIHEAGRILVIDPEEGAVRLVIFAARSSKPTMSARPSGLPASAAAALLSGGGRSSYEHEPDGQRERHRGRRARCRRLLVVRRAS